jgi:outer membrane biosynthesis protein TonB
VPTPEQATPTTIDHAALAQAFTEFGLDIVSADCGTFADDAAPVPPADAEPEPVPATEPEPEPEPKPEPEPEMQMQMQASEAVPEDAPASTPPVIHNPERKWLMVMMATFLVGVLVWVFARRRRTGAGKPVSTEPATEELLPERAVSAAVAAAAASGPQQHPGRFGLLRARLPDGQVLEQRIALGSDGTELSIGRAADWSIDHPSLSRMHARIGSVVGALVLEDLGSTNGTLLGHLPCLPGEIFYLHDGDIVLLGEIAIALDLQAETTTP